MEAMNRATRGLASEQEQLAIANTLLGQGIATTDAELEKVVEVSRRLGGAFRNLGAAEAADEFALMIANMSVERLDSFSINSGVVRQRIKELMEETKGMTREAAFFQATMEGADKILAKLGPELESVITKQAELAAVTANTKVAFGDLLLSGGDTVALFDRLIAVVGRVEVGLQGLAAAADQFDILVTSIKEIGLAFDVTSQNVLDFFTGLGKLQTLGMFEEGLTQMGTALVDAFTENEALGDAIAENSQVMEMAVTGIGSLTEAQQENNEEVKDLTDTYREFAANLIDINQDATERVEDTWEQFFEDEKALFEDSQKTLAKIQADFDKDSERTELKHQLKLSRLREDARKDKDKAQAKFDKEDKQDRKRDNVDALSDQRLFDFELQLLAADGQGNRIRELIERRDIEEEIAAEKAAVENQIEKDARAEELATIAETADLRIQRLREDNALENSFKEADLAETLAAEEQNFAERSAELRKFRDEKLRNIEESRAEAVAALAQELVEMGELTKEELAALTPVAGKLGEDTGKAFADGLVLGFAQQDAISQLLDGLSGVSGVGAGTTRANDPFRIGPRGFAHGTNSFGGGSAMVGEHGPEMVGLPQGSNVTANNNVDVSVNGIGGDALGKLIEGAINGALQEYTDDILTPIFAN